MAVFKNGHQTPISEWMDESSWFFACYYILVTLIKLKVTLIVIGGYVQI